MDWLYSNQRCPARTSCGYGEQTTPTRSASLKTYVTASIESSTLHPIGGEKGSSIGPSTGQSYFTISTPTHIFFSHQKFHRNCQPTGYSLGLSSTTTRDSANQKPSVPKQKPCRERMVSKNKEFQIFREDSLSSKADYPAITEPKIREQETKEKRSREWTVSQPTCPTN